MTNEPELKLQQIDDLLAERAAFGLSVEDERELAKLLAGLSLDRESFENTAARVALAFHPGPLEPLPEQLRKRIASAAADHFATSAAIVQNNETETEQRPNVSRRTRYREFAAWIAAAVCLLVAVGVLWRDRSSSPTTPAVGRAKLLDEASDVIQLPWVTTGDPTAKTVVGDVVWSNSKQSGYMRFKGLAANEPSKNAYQLWIFDADQDPRYPIDGGVFAIGPATIDKTTGDSIVPIHATLRVVSPRMFAVTVEKPGGVVVSSRDRIAVLAKVAPVGG